MTLRDREHGAEAARQKDRSLRRAEERMSDASAAAMRRFLRRMREAVSEDRLTAAVEPSARLPDIAEANGWWEDAIDEDMAGRVEEVWRTGYHDTRDGELTAGNLDRVGEHLARVKDRLSRTATPTIPERAMDTARKALAEETARGSSIATQSQRLAAEFGWDEDAAFWRERMDDLDRAVDSRLDAIGPPGDPAREAARLDDPDIRALQADRAEARTRIDRVESEWQTRAERISRTETTGAYNAGGRDAAATEGAQAKRWVATSDARTRDSHLAASGQCVPLAEPFDVGGSELDMPADPSGAAHETINCRCTLVYADSCEEAEGLYGDVEDTIDEERQRRGQADRRAAETADLDASQRAARDQLARADNLDELDAGELDEAIGKLPVGRQVQIADGVRQHRHRTGPARAVRDDANRLHVVEDAVLDRAGVDAEDFVQRSRRELDRAMPGGTEGDSPMRTLVYSDSPNVTREAEAGFRVAGLADDQGVSVYTAYERADDVDSFVKAPTLHHETGHSLMHASDMRVHRRGVDAVDAEQRATREALADDLDPRIADAFGGRDDLLDQADRGRMSSHRLLDSDDPDDLADIARGQFDSLDEARAASERWIAARDARLAEPRETIERLAGYTDERPEFFRVNVERPRRGESIPTHPRAPTQFQEAAERDAGHLATLTRAERAEIGLKAHAPQVNGLEWDDTIAGGHAVKLDGTARSGRFAVTEYGGSVPNGVEDWAESWRLYVHDRANDGLGTNVKTGRRARFADLFPERARVIEQWADDLGFDLTDVGP